MKEKSLHELQKIDVEYPSHQNTGQSPELYQIVRRGFQKSSEFFFVLPCQIDEKKPEIKLMRNKVRIKRGLFMPSALIENIYNKRNMRKIIRNFSSACCFYVLRGAVKVNDVGDHHDFLCHA